jgi:methenyltetrahydromethanopterin cyclohydrolase
MDRPTAEDIERAAQRAGWTLAPGRAAQIAAAAAPRLAAFAAARDSLDFDDDVNFAVVLQQTRLVDGAAS